MRNATREISIGNKKIGNNNPVLIQSMVTEKGYEVEKVVDQILSLEDAGCEIIRLAVPDKKTVQYINKIKAKINIPLVADIHFDYKLAIESINQGVDKIRINPGNIGSLEGLEKLVDSAKTNNIPIRIGVNSGSIEQKILDKYGVSVKSMVNSTLRHIQILEELDFFNIVVSLKSSNVDFTIKSFEDISEKIDYPLHIGITEAGTIYTGAIKSAIGIGTLLNKGIGDTVRVSMTSDPLEEIKCAKEILKCLGLRKLGVEIISCPTCGRTENNLIELADKVEKYCSNMDKPIKVAIMGCIVNGPGEAKEANIGVACERDKGVIFKNGEVLKTVKNDDIFDELIKEINAIEV